MAQRRTRDGIRLNNIIRCLRGFEGINIRPGRNHNYIANMQGFARPCPIASSTNARTMIVPWLRQVANVCDSSTIYSCLRNGRTYN
tara:strand:- start:1231 stop:1488 length:258 start_codon:yes stop_codon:yes gene_type:complete